MQQNHIKAPLSQNSLNEGKLKNKKSKLYKIKINSTNDV